MGLDLSLRSTGIAVIDAQAKLLHLTTITNKSTGAQRLQETRNRIEASLNQWRPDEIVVEFFNDVMHTRSSAECVWLHGITHLTIHDVGLAPALYISPATLKKWMVGRGNKVEKEEMVKAITEQYGETIEQHDAAEAYGLACLALERARYTLGEESIRGRAFTEYEREAMLRWRRSMG